ncbi:MAG: AAA family ATPase [Gammaproteobacteria bacterium]|nr:AAA family ATPase [Gammaproteobacteria bacterium]
MSVLRKRLRLHVLSRPGAFARAAHLSASNALARKRAVSKLKSQCPGVARRIRVGGRHACLVVLAGGYASDRHAVAQAVADTLGRPLHVISKYIGETEKNLDIAFEEAAGDDAVLFFDEADALLGKRTQVRDAHDRYANIEVSYLLARAEQFDSVVILASNLRSEEIDESIRRYTLVVDVASGDDD